MDETELRHIFLRAQPDEREGRFQVCAIARLKATELLPFVWNHVGWLRYLYLVYINVFLTVSHPILSSLTVGPWRRFYVYVGSKCTCAPLRIAQPRIVPTSYLYPRS